MYEIDYQLAHDKRSFTTAILTIFFSHKAKFGNRKKAVNKTHEKLMSTAAAVVSSSVNAMQSSTDKQSSC